MRIRAKELVKRSLHHLAYGVIGALVIAVGVFVYLLDDRPDLSVWHQAKLDAEFTVASEVPDFDAYLRLEERLFDQLEQQVYARVDGSADNRLNRYARGSRSDPGRWPTDWNRSYELRRDEPVAGALLLHGLSDSPYSLRVLARRLHRGGVSVIGLRVPGHGTAPSGLVRTRWQDMAAAVKLAVRHLRDRGGGKPFYLVGYSNGGALAVEYTLAAVDDPGLPRPAGVVLISPEIQITELAILAAWQRRLGRLFGLDKLAWQSIEPEYDPFKYNSFAINAGDLARRLTARIQDQLNRLQGTGKLEKMPPLLAFQSSVDATVSAPALVRRLFRRLPPAGHELVLFDINRQARVEPLLSRDPRTIFEPLLANAERGFTLTVVTNDSPDTSRVAARTMVHGAERETRVALRAQWPSDVYSVGHIALPFAKSDPLYGGPGAPASPGIQLGNVVLRGETGALRISPKAILRIHWNPFYDYVESRITDFLGLGGGG